LAITFDAAACRTLRARRFAPVHFTPLGSIYDIQHAVSDKATVLIYCESRIWKLAPKRRRIA
jgi:hypothetical protein